MGTQKAKPVQGGPQNIQHKLIHKSTTKNKLIKQQKTKKETERTCEKLIK